MEPLHTRLDPYRRLFESPLFGSYFWTLDGIVEANDRLLDMLGHDRAVLAAGALPWSAVNEPDEVERNAHAVRQMLATGTGPVLSTRFRRADGQALPVLVGAILLERDPPMGVGFVLDRREEEDARAAAQSSEARWRAFFEQAPVGIHVFDARGRHVLANPALLRIFGLAQEDLQGYVFGEDPEHARTGTRELAHRLLAGEVVTPPVLRHDARGSVGKGHAAWIQALGYPIRDDAGEVREVVVMSQDVTERMETLRALQDSEARLREALASAGEAARLKDEFLTTVSHELRAPLSGIVNWCAVLRQGLVDDASPEWLREHVARALEVIERNARHQATLVDDLLDVARLSRGRPALELQEVHVERLVETVVEDFRQSARDRGLTLDVRLPVDAPRLRADPARMRQVLANLVGNAIKFTPPGGQVQVRVEAGPDAVRIQVEDDGEGIAPGLLDHVFERFRQGDGSIARRHGGLGLGLSIARELVEAHGGTLAAASDGPGLGACFTIVLPRAA